MNKKKPELLINFQVYELKEFNRQKTLLGCFIYYFQKVYCIMIFIFYVIVETVRKKYRQH